MRSTVHRVAAMVLLFGASPVISQLQMPMPCTSNSDYTFERKINLADGTIKTEELKGRCVVRVGSGTGEQVSQLQPLGRPGIFSVTGAKVSGMTTRLFVSPNLLSELLEPSELLEEGLEATSEPAEPARQAASGSEASCLLHNCCASCKTGSVLRREVKRC